MLPWFWYTARAAGQGMRLKNSDPPYIPSSQPLPLLALVTQICIREPGETGVLGVEGIQVWGHLSQSYWTGVEWDDGAPVAILRKDMDTKQHRQAGLAQGWTTAP